jgi:imidazole glycerol-phosphate synthase subunit HisH
MKEDPVVIVDYGLSNILSVVNALTYLGSNCEVTNVPEKIAGSKTLILPGVGSFKKAMNSIKELSIDEALLAASKSGCKNIGNLFRNAVIRQYEH